MVSRSLSERGPFETFSAQGGQFAWPDKNRLVRYGIIMQNNATNLSNRRSNLGWRGHLILSIKFRYALVVGPYNGFIRAFVDLPEFIGILRTLMGLVGARSDLLVRGNDSSSSTSLVNQIQKCQTPSLQKDLTATNGQ